MSLEYVVSTICGFNYIYFALQNLDEGFVVNVYIIPLKKNHLKAVILAKGTVKVSVTAQEIFINQIEIAKLEIKAIKFISPDYSLRLHKQIK